jgi:hypothetical protein
MNHEEYAAEARQLQREIDEVLERRDYARVAQLSARLVERARRACDCKAVVTGHAQDHGETTNQ